MSKKLLIAAAVLSIAFAGAAFAAVENIKVSGDITVTGITQDLSLGAGASIPDPITGAVTMPRDEEDFIISQVRIRFDADLTEGVSAVVQLISEEVWGIDWDNADDVEVDLAYIELKEFLYQPLTLIVGKQHLRYGNGLIIGDPDTNQTAVNQAFSLIGVADEVSLRKDFDAVRAIIDYSPYTLDVVYAKLGEGALNLNDDITLFGANLAYEWSSYDGITELYFWNVANQSESMFTVMAQDENSDTFVLGGRTQWNPTDKITLAAEVAGQLGDYRRVIPAPVVHGHLQAMAVQLGSEYRFLNEYNATIGGSYTYLSGDDPNTDDFEGWSPLFEDQSAGVILNILAANSNCHLFKFTGSMMPREDITVGMLYTRALLAEKLVTGVDMLDNPGTPYNNLWSPGVGSHVINNYRINTDEKFFGDEVDLWGIYDYTEDVQIKVIGGLFLPGDFFTHDNDTPAYTIRTSLGVSF